MKAGEFGTLPSSSRLSKPFVSKFAHRGVSGNLGPPKTAFNLGFRVLMSQGESWLQRTGPTPRPSIGAMVPVPVEGQMTVWFGLSPWSARGINAPTMRGGRRKP